MGVANATLTYRSVVVDAEARRDRRTSNALHVRQRTVARANYTWTVDRDNTDLTELLNAGYEDFIRATARANSDLVLSREGARRNWKLTVGDLNVQQVHAIVASQIERAETMRSDTVTLARSVANAVNDFTVAQAAADSNRGIALAITEGTESIYSADSAAIRTQELAVTQGQFQVDRAAARGNYHVALHDSHRLATAVYSNLVGTPAALYYAELAGIDYNRALADANAAFLYYQDLAVVQVNRQLTLNAAETNYVRQRAAATVEYATQQTAADRYMAWSVAAGIETLHVAQATANADLAAANAATQGAADIAAAEAARDRDAIVVAADYEFAQTITPAQADLVIACARFYWFWFFDCSDESATYDQLYQDAVDRRDDARDSAEEAYQQRLRDIENRETRDWKDIRIDFVTSIGTAQLAFANRQASVLLENASASARNNVVRAHRYSVASFQQTGDVAQAEYRYSVDGGQIDVIYQQRIRDAAVVHGFDQGVAEGTYQTTVAADSALQWRAIADASTGDAYLQFRAAQSEAVAVWFNDLTPELAVYRQRTAAAKQQQLVDRAVVQAAYDDARSFAEQSHAVGVSGDQQSLAVSNAIADLQNAVFVANNQNAISVGTAEAEFNHAVRSVRADTAYQAALIQIEHQYEQDNDNSARQESTKQVVYRKSAAVANADAVWRRNVGNLEQTFVRDEAAREFAFASIRADFQRVYQLSRADADRVREIAFAQAQSAYWLAETVAQNWQTENEALAYADLMSANHVAEVSAMSTLETALALPWAAFEHDRALASQSAWETVRSQYLTLQQDIGTQESLFTSQRASTYLAVATDIALATYAHDGQRATLIANAMRDAAAEQRGFAVSLANTTVAYRTSLAEAERVYDIAIAEAVRDGTSTTQAGLDRTDAVELAENRYEDEFGRLSRARRERLAQDGFELATATNTLQFQLATLLAFNQGALNTAVVNAYYDSAADSGLEAVKANLVHAFTINEATALSNAVAGIASNPWSDLASADATARQTHYVLPLADLQQQHRKTLAGVRNDYHLAVTDAALSLSQQMDYWDSLADNLQTAGLVALVATYNDGDVALPDNITPPTPELGQVGRVTSTYSSSYTGVPEIDFYGHPGIYSPWGTNLWYGSSYLGVSWLWSNYGQYNYGWGNSLYSGNYGSFGGFYSGGFFGGYYGYWNYAPWTFSWNGWSGGYVTPPFGLGNGFSIDLPGSLNEFGQSVSGLIQHSQTTIETLSKPEDDRAPVLDAVSGRIQLGDTSTTFQASQPTAATAAHSLANFTDASNTQAIDARASQLATVTTEIVATQPEPLPGQTGTTTQSTSAEDYDFDRRFKVSVEGRAVYVEEYRVVLTRSNASYNPFIADGSVWLPGKQESRTHVVGFVDNQGWINLSGIVGHGRARLTALEKAADAWNGLKMQSVLRAAFAADPSLASDKPQLQQLIDGIRSPYEIEELSPTIGIFIGGTNMHFYGVGNVERMYNQYSGTKFYYGGIGNAVDSEHPLLEGGTARTEFHGNINYMMADILRYGRGKQIHIFGWSRGGAQAIELARRLDGEGIAVDFVGAFDPVYSVGLPGQQSALIHASPAGKLGNYITADVPKNVRTAVAIYAMNEVRSYFPATNLEPESGSSTNIIRIGSPGAHGEVGGHWASNRFVQQLNYHVMMKYAEDQSSADFVFWDSGNPVTLDPQIEAIYNSSYTTFVALDRGVQE